jgi:hypothetical protein
MRGMGRVYLRGNVWWVQYYFNGRKHRESTGPPNLPDAMRLLRSRLEEIGRGRLVGPAIEKTTFDDLAELLLTDYRINRKRSITRIEDSVEHLGRVFTGFRAINVTSDRIMAYIGTRQNADAANGTINRELSALRRMFRLGEQVGKVAHRPHIAMLREDNVRTGFFEAEQFRSLVSHMPVSLSPVMTAAYLTGWRITSELLTRQWGHVDFPGG